MNERPLDGMQLWMVKQNVQYAKDEGLQPVLDRLNAQGYHRVAKAVEQTIRQEQGIA